MSIIQPLIRPLYDTRSAHEVLELMQRHGRSSFDVVQSYWQKASDQSGSFDDWWRQTLRDGVIADSAAKTISLPTPQIPKVAPATNENAFTLTFAPDASVFDGSFSNNAWLQECPKPFTKQVWGNALHVAESDAQALGLADGDIVRVNSGGVVLDAPVLVRPGQARGTIAATLGYGRSAAGSLGTDVGFDINRLRQSASPWATDNVRISKTGGRQNLLLTQLSFSWKAKRRICSRVLRLPIWRNPISA